MSGEESAPWPPQVEATPSAGVVAEEAAAGSASWSVSLLSPVGADSNIMYTPYGNYFGHQETLAAYHHQYTEYAPQTPASPDYAHQQSAWPLNHQHHQQQLTPAHQQHHHQHPLEPLYKSLSMQFSNSGELFVHIQM